MGSSVWLTPAWCVRKDTWRAYCVVKRHAGIGVAMGRADENERKKRYLAGIAFIAVTFFLTDASSLCLLFLLEGENKAQRCSCAKTK